MTESVDKRGAATQMQAQGSIEKRLRDYDRELSVKERAQAADYLESQTRRLYEALDVLRGAGIHVEESWCWCRPEVTDYSGDGA